MTIVQPVLSAIDAWLAIWYSLPFSIKALSGLSVFFLILSKVIKIVFGGGSE